MGGMDCLKERQWPFLLSGDQGGRRFFQSSDKSVQGYVWEHGDQWELDCLRDLPDGPFLFKTACDAAFFACMKNREYFAEINVLDEQIEIRISPDFGRCYGQWAVALYHPDGKCVGLDCAPTVAQAKIVGLQKACAYLGNVSDDSARRTSGGWTGKSGKPNQTQLDARRNISGNATLGHYQSAPHLWPPQP